MGGPGSLTRVASPHHRIMTPGARRLVRAFPKANSLSMTAHRAFVVFLVTVAAAIGAACKSPTSTEIVIAVGFRVTPSDTFLPQLGTVQIGAAAVDTSGHGIPVHAGFTVSDSNLISITSDGLVTSLGPTGTAFIEAAWGPFENYAYVTVHDSSLVRVSVPNRAYGAAIAPNGIAYTTQVDLGKLRRVDLQSHTVGAEVLVGNIPTEVAFSSTGAVAYVTNQSSQNVSILNVAGNTQIGVIPAPGAAGPDGRAGANSPKRALIAAEETTISSTQRRGRGRARSLPAVAAAASCSIRRAPSGSCRTRAAGSTSSSRAGAGRCGCQASRGLSLKPPVSLSYPLPCPAPTTSKPGITCITPPTGCKACGPPRPTRCSWTCCRRALALDYSTSAAAPDSCSKPPVPAGSTPSAWTSRTRQSGSPGASRRRHGWRSGQGSSSPSRAAPSTTSAASVLWNTSSTWARASRRCSASRSLTRASASLCRTRTSSVGKCL